MNLNLPCKKSKPNKSNYHKLKKSEEATWEGDREKEKLALAYNIEKEQVSKIVQPLVSDKEELQVRL